jgi:vacuolar-type H+-ATPase subunit I/STV1
MLENSNQLSKAVLRIRRYDGELLSVDGPLCLDGKPYWSVYFTKKTLLKGLRGVTLIVLNEKGETIKNWKTYRKIAIMYLMPKISEKFVALYSNELDEVAKMSKFLKDCQERIYEFKIVELIERAKTYGAAELMDCLASFKTQLIELEKHASKILTYMKGTKILVDALLTENCYSTLRKFVKRFSSEEKEFKKLRKNISEQAYIIFNMANIIRELGMRKKESKTVIESINKYISVVQKIEKTIDRIMKTRRLLLGMYRERKYKVREFYKEMLKRTT